MPDDRLTQPQPEAGVRAPAQPGDTVRAVREVLAGAALDEAASRLRMEPTDLAAAVDVFQQAGHRALKEQAASLNWCQLYLEFTDWPGAEKTAADHLAPLLHQAEKEGGITAWWFIRKHPCWRLRLCTPDAAVKIRVGAALDGLVSDGHLRRWWPGIYEAETPAFGGGIGMTVAHQLFTADSRAVLDLTRHGEGPLGRRELSVLLCTTLMRAAALEWYEQGDAWHRVTEERPLPADVTPDRLQPLAGNLRTLLLADTAPDGAVLGQGGPAASAAEWADAFRHAGRALGTAAREGTLDRGLRHVLAYHVIFHWNRLGLSLRTQSALAWAARAAILDVPAATGTPMPSNRQERA